MLMRTRYHPLVDRDTEGKDKYPVFCTEDEAAVLGRHSYYLEEMFPRFYRLCRGMKGTGRDEKGILIHCPLCGGVMDPVSAPKDRKRLPMYMCRKCAGERRR